MHFYQTRNITFFIQLQIRFQALVNCRMCNTIMYPSNCSNSMFLQHWLLELIEYMEVPQCGLQTYVLWRLFSAGDQSTQFILPRTQKEDPFSGIGLWSFRECWLMCGTRVDLKRVTTHKLLFEQNCQPYWGKHCKDNTNSAVLSSQ